MKASELIAGIEAYVAVHGDVECQMQNEPLPGEPVISHEHFFIVGEEYDDGLQISIRTWPY